MNPPSSDSQAKGKKPLTGTVVGDLKRYACERTRQYHPIPGVRIIRVTQNMPSENRNSSDETDASKCVEYQYDGDTPPSIAIVQAIAAIEDIDPMDSPTDLGITLYDHVDPAALDQLVTGNSGDSAVTVDLTVHNDYQYDVRVQDSGRLVIERIT